MKILVIQTRPGIGDFCIFLPYAQKISQLEKSKITLLTKKRSAAKELTINDPHFDEVIYMPKKIDLNFLKYLKSKNFKKTYIFHYGIKFFLMSKLLGIRKTYFYGFIKKKTNISLEPKSQINRWFNRLIKNYVCNLYFFKKNETKNILIGIGGSGDTKKWNIDKYIELIAKISKLFPSYNYIIAGGIDELNDYLKIKNSLKKLDIVSICKLSISESIKYIQSSKIYVGNDTGFMHISGMLHIKSFGLFGDTPTNYIDYNSYIKSIIPQNKTEISHGSRAIDQIEVDWVLSQIKQDLN